MTKSPLTPSAAFVDVSGFETRSETQRTTANLHANKKGSKNNDDGNKNKKDDEDKIDVPDQLRHQHSILKEAINTCSNIKTLHQRRSITWKDDSGSIIHPSDPSCFATSSSSAFSDHSSNLQYPAAPPLKKRFSSNFALGRDLPGWNRNSMIPTPTFDDVSTLSYSSSMEKTLLETPQVGLAQRSSTPSSTNIGSTDTPWMLRPNRHTPHSSIYNRNFSNSVARGLPTPSSLQLSDIENYNDNTMNHVDSINDEQMQALASFHAPLPSSRPYSRNENHFLSQLQNSLQGYPQHNAPRAFYPPPPPLQRHPTNTADPMQIVSVSMSLADAIAHLTGTVVQGNGNVIESHRDGAPGITNEMVIQSEHGPLLINVTRLTHLAATENDPPYTNTSDEALFNADISILKEPNSTLVAVENDLASAPAHIDPLKTKPHQTRPETTAGSNQNAAFKTDANQAQFLSSATANGNASLQTKSDNNVKKKKKKKSRRKEDKPKHIGKTEYTLHSKKKPINTNTEIKVNYNTTPSIGAFKNNDNDEGCSCKRSKCLKLYCKCFQGERFCDSHLCSCSDCHNLIEHNGPKGQRRLAIEDIKKRRKDAFGSRPAKRSGEGCSCKNIRCLKKYCDCYAIGVQCTLEKCTCNSCGNGRPSVMAIHFASLLSANPNVTSGNLPQSPSETGGEFVVHKI